MSIRKKAPASSASPVHGEAAIAPRDLQPQTAPPAAARPWIIYCRVSTEEQANEGASMAAQENACRGYCTQRHLAVAEIVSDPGISAKDLHRPGVQRVLNLLRSGAVAGVIVWRLDRLTRSLRDLLSLIDLSESSGIALVSVTEHIATDNPMGRLMLHMMGSMAQWERETIAERIRLGVRQRQEQGAWLGGSIPAGCRISMAEDGCRRLAPDPETGPTVAQIWTRVAQGATLMDVVHFLRGTGIPAPRGKLWRVQTAATLLHQERLVDVLVDRTTFDAATKVLSGRYRTFSKKRICKAVRIYPLNHLARCANCGGSMCGVPSRSKGHEYYYYRCMMKPKGLCDMKDLPAVAWEKATCEGLASLMRPNGQLEQRLRTDAAAANATGRTLIEEQAALIQQRTEVYDRQARLVSLVEDGSVTPEAAKARLRELQDQLVDLDRQTDQLAGRIAAVEMEGHGIGMILEELRTSLAGLAEAPPELQCRAFQTFCHSLTIGNKSDGLPVLEFALHLPALWAGASASPEKETPIGGEVVSSQMGVLVAGGGFEPPTFGL
jgi:site-specific DNA recombinase